MLHWWNSFLTKKRRKQFILVGFTIAIVAIGLISWWGIIQKKEAAVNKLEAQAYAIQTLYETKKDFMQNYYEILKVGIKGMELTAEYSQAKFTIVSILYNFIYRPQPSDYYSRSGEYSDEKKFTFAPIVERLNLRHSESVNSVAFSHDDKYIVSGSDNDYIKIWDASTGKEIKTLNGGYPESVKSVAFSQDDKLIVSGLYNHSIIIWDVSTGKEFKALKGHSESVNSVAFSHDDKLIVSGANDNSIKVWNVSTGKNIKTLRGHSHFVESVAFSHDDKYIVSGSYDSSIKIWNTSTGKNIKTLRGHSHFVESVAFSHDDKYIVSGSYDSSIKIWDVLTGREIKTLNGHSKYVNSVVFSHDDKFILSGSGDASVKIWNASTLGNAKEIKILNGYSRYVNSVAFSHDNKLIVSSSGDRTIKIWDVFTEKEIKTLRGHSESVSSLAFSHDDKIIVSGSFDVSIKIWDAFTGKEIKTLNGHYSMVNSVAFSHDDKYIASGSYDNSIAIWETELETILPLACIDLKYQMEDWLLLSNPPFSKEEIKEVQSKCDLLAQKAEAKKKRETLGSEYEYLEVARNTDGKERIQYLKDALKLKPDFASAKQALVDEYLNQEKYKEALQFEEKKEYVYLYRARNYLIESTEPEEVTKAKKEKAISDYKEVLKINPIFEAGKSELAALYFAEEKYEEAFLLESKKEYLYLNRARKYLKEATDLLKNGQKVIKKKQEEKAISDYKEALKINPKLQPARVELAEIYFNKGEEFENKAKQLYNNKNFTAAVFADCSKAIENFNKALEYNPDNAIYYQKRGDAFYYKKDIPNAIADYKKFLELETDDHEALNKGALEFLGPEKEIPTRELDLAVAHSKKSLELSPDNPDYLNTLAEVYLKLGDKLNAKKYNNLAKKFAIETNNFTVIKSTEHREEKIDGK